MCRKIERLGILGPSLIDESTGSRGLSIRAKDDVFQTSRVSKFFAEQTFKAIVLKISENYSNVLSNASLNQTCRQFRASIFQQPRYREKLFDTLTQYVNYIRVFYPNQFNQVLLSVLLDGKRQRTNWHKLEECADLAQERLQIDAFNWSRAQTDIKLKTLSEKTKFK